MPHEQKQVQKSNMYRPSKQKFLDMHTKCIELHKLIDFYYVQVQHVQSLFLFFF